MQAKNGRFSLFLSTFICVAVVGYCLFHAVTRTAAGESPSVKEYTFSSPSELSEVSVSQSSEDTAAAPAATIENAMGKIVANFISPYSTTTCYNNIYLRNKTDLSLDLATILSEPNPISIARNDEPQVLIVHTHTTECYLKETRDYYTADDLTRTEDGSYNVTAVGNIFTEKLNAAGIVALHNTTIHDSTYTGSYGRSATTVTDYLSRYPSIKVVIDLHRDSISLNDTDRIKPICEVNGKDAAQVMLVMGCGANLSGFENWRQNLRFALKYQQTMEVLYPGLARSITFLNSRYNENLSPGAILLEIGTEANSIEEASYGASLAADALVSYLNTLK